LSIVVQDPIWYGVFAKLAILMTRPFNDSLMPHVNNSANFSAGRSETDKSFIFHKRVISWLYLSSAPIENSFFLSLLKLGLNFVRRVVAVSFC
jgi:hypothetical protein